jgi:Protein of unknown function (DUF2817)
VCITPTLKKLAVIDFHTGLGRAGYGEPIHVGSASDFALAKEWYGEEVRSLNQGGAVATALTGSVADAFPQSTPDLKVIYVALAGGLAGLGRLFGCHANLFSSSRNNLRRNSDGSLRYFHCYTSPMMGPRGTE